MLQISTSMLSNPESNKNKILLKNSLKLKILNKHLFSILNFKSVIILYVHTLLLYLIKIKILKNIIQGKNNYKNLCIYK